MGDDLKDVWHVTDDPKILVGMIPRPGPPNVILKDKNRRSLERKIQLTLAALLWNNEYLHLYNLTHYIYSVEDYADGRCSDNMIRSEYLKARYNVDRACTITESLSNGHLREILSEVVNALTNCRDGCYYSLQYLISGEKPRTDEVECHIIRDIMSDIMYPLPTMVVQDESKIPEIHELALDAYSHRDWSDIKDRRLNNSLLYILADALIDAGVPEEYPCYSCNGKGSHSIYIATRASKDKRKTGEVESLNVGGDTFSYSHMCEVCRGKKFFTHPVIELLRSPGPYYRGFYALDHVLGC